MFEAGSKFPKGWHLVNTAQGQQGEFTLCGIAFDGDATGVRETVEERAVERVTCPECVAIIKLCKSATL